MSNAVDDVDQDLVDLDGNHGEAAVSAADDVAVVIDPRGR